jgi:hypothetical protein
MAKQKKFKGNNARIVGETRLTQREMKKMSAAYFNVQRDFATRTIVEQANPARTTEDVKPAVFDELS